VTDQCELIAEECLGKLAAMTIEIERAPLRRESVSEMARQRSDMIKAVVDLRRGVMAMGGTSTI
jgi:hypothetical protein